MSWPTRRRQRWWHRLPEIHPLSAFLVGFAFCYLVAALLAFHFLVTIGYSPQMAVSRSVLWMWTARVGTAMVEQGMRDGTVSIKRPECRPQAMSEWWC